MRILICVTFHYDKHRLQYLKKILKSFINFTHFTNIYIITNTKNAHNLSKIKQTFPHVPFRNEIKIKSFNIKSHPHDLILSHKKFFLNEFLNTNIYTHFLHTEDDMLFNKNNFKYWIKYRNYLNKYKIIPSFFRIEKKNKDDYYRSTDVGFKVLWFLAPKISFKNMIFLNMPNPSQSNYLVDHELAREMYENPPNLKKHFYLNSNIGIRETTDIGPIFSNVPKFFISRNFVPFKKTSKAIYRDCLIVHLPGNYANNKNTKLGKIDINKIIYYFPFPDSTLLRNIKYFLYVYFRNFINYTMLLFIK